MYFGQFYLPAKFRPHESRAALRRNLATGATWRRERQISGHLRRVVDYSRAMDTALCTATGPTYDDFLTPIALPISNRRDGAYKFGVLSVRRVSIDFARIFPDGITKNGISECAQIHLKKPPAGQKFFTRAQALAALALSEIHACGIYGIQNEDSEAQHAGCRLVGFPDAVVHNPNSLTHWSLCRDEVFAATRLMMPPPVIPLSFGWFPMGGESAIKDRHPS